jgi:hypothetical protein
MKLSPFGVAPQARTSGAELARSIAADDEPLLSWFHAFSNTSGVFLLISCSFYIYYLVLACPLPPNEPGSAAASHHWTSSPLGITMSLSSCTHRWRDAKDQVDCSEAVTRRRRTGVRLHRGRTRDRGQEGCSHEQARVFLRFS